MRFIKIFFKNILTLIIIFAILAFANRRYLGGFSTLEAKEQQVWAYTIAYVSFTGDYGKVGPSMAKVYEILSGAGIVSATGVGVYYDNPALISWVNLRSDVGAVITLKDKKTLAKNKEIKVATFSAGTKIVVEFPLKNSISYMIGPMKAYPVMEEYMEEKWYKTGVVMMELYDSVAKKIYYIADVIK